MTSLFIQMEQVIIDIMESVGKTDAKPAVYKRNLLTMTENHQILRRNAQLQDAHMAAATGQTAP